MSGAMGTMVGEELVGNDSSEAEDENSGWVTRCICARNSQVDGFMIECERCQVWQHGDCVKVDKAHIPDEYFCESCRPDLHNPIGHWTGISSRSTGSHVAAAIQSTNNTSNNHKSSKSSKKRRIKSSRKPESGASGAIGSALQTSGGASGIDPSLPPGSIHTSQDQDPPLEHQSTSHLEAENSPGTMTPPQGGMSREERKIFKIMQTIQIMEDRDKKRRRSAETLLKSESVVMEEFEPPQGSKRRRSRLKDSSADGIVVNAVNASQNNVLDSDFRGSSRKHYDIDQLKTKPDLISQLFPVSPLYLGTKVYLLNYRDEDHQPQSQISGTVASAVDGSSATGSPRSGLPSVESELMEAEASARYLQDHVSRKLSQDISMRDRSQSPAHRTTTPRASATPSPCSSSVPTSPKQHRQSSPPKDVAMVDAAHSPPTEPAVTAPLPEVTQTRVSGLPTIPKIAPSSFIVPKRVPPSGPSQSNTPADIKPSFLPATNQGVDSRAAVVIPVGKTSSSATGVNPLSNLSELMQSYMNSSTVSNGEHTPIVSSVASLDLSTTRFKPSLGGASRWTERPKQALPGTPIIPSRTSSNGVLSRPQQPPQRPPAQPQQQPYRQR